MGYDQFPGMRLSLGVIVSWKVVRRTALRSTNLVSAVVSEKHR